MSRLDDLKAKYPAPPVLPLDPQPWVCRCGCMVRWGEEAYLQDIRESDPLFLPRAGYNHDRQEYLARLR